MTSSILLLTEVPRGLRGNLHRTDPGRDVAPFLRSAAVQLRPLLDAFVSYDHRQAAVAREVGLRVVSPGA